MTNIYKTPNIPSTPPKYQEIDPLTSNTSANAEVEDLSELRNNILVKLNQYQEEASSDPAKSDIDIVLNMMNNLNELTQVSNQAQQDLVTLGIKSDSSLTDLINDIISRLGEIKNNNFQNLKGILVYNETLTNKAKEIQEKKSEMELQQLKTPDDTDLQADLQKLKLDEMLLQTEQDQVNRQVTSWKNIIMSLYRNIEVGLGDKWADAVI